MTIQMILCRKFVIQKEASQLCKQKKVKLFRKTRLSKIRMMMFTFKILIIQL